MNLSGYMAHSFLAGQGKGKEGNNARTEKIDGKEFQTRPAEQGSQNACGHAGDHKRKLLFRREGIGEGTRSTDRSETERAKILKKTFRSHVGPTGRSTGTGENLA